MPFIYNRLRQPVTIDCDGIGGVTFPPEEKVFIDPSAMESEALQRCLGEILRVLEEDSVEAKEEEVTTVEDTEVTKATVRKHKVGGNK